MKYKEFKKGDRSVRAIATTLILRVKQATFIECFLGAMHWSRLLAPLTTSFPLKTLTSHGFHDILISGFSIPSAHPLNPSTVAWNSVAPQKRIIIFFSILFYKLLNSWTAFTAKLHSLSIVNSRYKYPVKLPLRSPDWYRLTLMTIPHVWPGGTTDSTHLKLNSLLNKKKSYIFPARYFLTQW